MTQPEVIRLATLVRPGWRGEGAPGWGFGRGVRTGVVYHSREWEELVEQGWITHTVDEFVKREGGGRK